MTRKTCFAVVLAGLLAVPATADQGDWILRFGPMGLDSDLAVNQTDADGTVIDVTTSTGSGASFTAEYLGTPRLGFELGAQWSTTDFQLVALDDEGNTLTAKDELAPFMVSVGANLHLTPDYRGDLYFGPVVTYMENNNLLFAARGERTNVLVDNGYAFGAVAGFDYPFGNEGWMFCTSVRYLDADLDFTTEGDPQQTEAFDPLTFGIGFGYRF